MQAGQGIVGSPGHSPALKYELRLKEELITSGKAGPTVARTAMCFEILDELLPQLGIFQRAMRLVRNELYGSVYSSQHFTSSGRHGSKKSARHKPEQLPYFEIARKYIEKQDEKVSKMEEEISSLKEQLYTCEADIEKASSVAESCRHDIKDRDIKINKLNSALRVQIAECERLQKIVNQHQRAQERLRQEVEYRIFSLKVRTINNSDSTIASLTGENAELSQYKNTYDDIQEVLSKPRVLGSVADTNTPDNTESELERQIKTALELQKQLLQTQNILTDEYDAFLNSHIAKMADELAVDIHKRVRQKRRKFKENIAEILNELQLLKLHICALECRRDQISSVEAQYPKHMSVVVPDHPLNPFVPQQQILNKYAIMVMTSSDNGESFFPLKGSQFCPNCGNKTTTCPHKALVAPGLLVQLPLHSTHIKVLHPSQCKVQSQHTHLKETAVSDSKDSNQQDSVQTTGTVKQEPDFQKVWKYYYSRYKMEQGIPRDLSQEKLLLLVYQFYATVLQQDDTVLAGEEDVPSLLESLFKFMCKRYIVTEVVATALHDLIAALEKNCSKHKELLVASLSVCGQVEASVFRYLLLLASFVDVLPWQSMKEFHLWASIVYPSLQEEDVEQLAMNFTAHSNNRVSKTSVMDYLTWLLLRHKEPMVLQMEAKLQEYPSRKPEGMQEVEFAEAMTRLVPLTPDHLCRRLYMQSLASTFSGDGVTDDTVPAKRLAYNAAYLSMLQTTTIQLAGLQQLSHTQATMTYSGPEGRVIHLPSSRGDMFYTIAKIKSMMNRMK